MLTQLFPLTNLTVMLSTDCPLMYVATVLLTTVYHSFALTQCQTMKCNSMVMWYSSMGHTTAVGKRGLASLLTSLPFFRDLKQVLLGTNRKTQKAGVWMTSLTVYFPVNFPSHRFHAEKHTHSTPIHSSLNVSAYSNNKSTGSVKGVRDVWGPSWLPLHKK